MFHIDERGDLVDEDGNVWLTSYQQSLFTPMIPGAIERRVTASMKSGILKIPDEVQSEPWDRSLALKTLTAQKFVPLDKEGEE